MLVTVPGSAEVLASMEGQVWPAGRQGEAVEGLEMLWVTIWAAELAEGSECEGANVQKAWPARLFMREKAHVTRNTSVRPPS